MEAHIERAAVVPNPAACADPQEGGADAAGQGGRHPDRAPVAHREDRPTAVAFGPRGRLLAIGRTDGAVRLLERDREVALLRDKPHTEGLAGCDALFEVSFLDLDEVLDEGISLLDVQFTFADELAGGFEYLEWNRTLTPLGEG